MGGYHGSFIFYHGEIYDTWGFKAFTRENLSKTQENNWSCYVIEAPVLESKGAMITTQILMHNAKCLNLIKQYFRLQPVGGVLTVAAMLIKLISLVWWIGESIEILILSMFFGSS